MSNPWHNDPIEAPAVAGPTAPPWMSDPIEGKAAPTPSTIEALGRGAHQGVTFNFGDELTGVQEASGLPSWTGGFRPVVGGARLLAESVAPSVFGTGATDAYNAAVERERAANEAARSAHPWAYFGGEIGGSVATLPFAPVLAPAKVAQGAGIVARTSAGAANLAATGAAYGAAAGAGAGEGDIVDRLPSTAKGAAIGAALTPAIGGVARGVGWAGGKVADHVTATRNPQAVADRLVARNLERDAANVPALADDIERANAAGQQVTLADVAGPNTRGLVGTIARQPGEGRTAAREFLEARQVGAETMPSQGERISAQLGNILGDEGAIATADSIIARRSAAADPMYRAAYARRLDYDAPEGRELLALLDRVPPEARANANRILKISDREGHQLVWRETPNDAGMYPLATAPNGRQWQYIKEGLDTTIEANRDSITGRLNSLGGAVQNLKTEMLSKLDALNPAYRAARTNFAGESELLQALRNGADAFAPGTSVEAVQKSLRGLSKGEAEMYRLGAANALRNRLINIADGNDKAKAAFGTPAYREKIGAMMKEDPQGHAEFIRALNNESAMYRTRNEATGNSKTIERGNEDADLALGLVDAGVAVGSLQHGRIGPMLGVIARHMAKVDPDKRGRVLEAARNVILNPDANAGREFLRRVEAANMKPGTKQRVIAALRDIAVPRAATSSLVGMQ